MKAIGRCVCLAGHEDMAALVRRAAQEVERDVENRHAIDRLISGHTAADDRRMGADTAV